MRSLRSRLLALWIMLVVSGAATGYLLVKSFQQTSNARVARSEELLARACRDIADRYQSFASEWHGPIDDRAKHELTLLVQAALSPAIGVEGGIWRADTGSLAYAFPTYEGTGPKTDLPVAELNGIREVNAEAAQGQRPAGYRQPARSQVLLIQACPLRGGLAGMTGWTMTRAFTAEGPAFTQLLVGLLVLALTILGSAIWLARVLLAWSRKLALLETALATSDSGTVDLPKLPVTGEQELDRFVDALNLTGARLAQERRRAAAAERLAAVGRLSAGLAHEIRNPIAAMRLKAENALASPDADRKRTALEAILAQIARLDTLLRNLLQMTQANQLKPEAIELAAFLRSTVEPHRELATAKNLALAIGTVEPRRPLPSFDPSQTRRALDNLILNAIQSTPAGGTITVDAVAREDHLVLRVSDSGPGIGDDIRERIFEPFVTARADGTGLGLAIVREIARAHHGDVRLVPTLSGACFEIEMPWQMS